MGRTLVITNGYSTFSMNRKTRFNTIGSALALFSLVTVQTIPALSAELMQATSPQTIDIELGQNGLLRGQLVDPQGQVQAAVPVTVDSQDGRTITTRTDRNGYFTITGMRGGVCIVTVDGSQTLCRAWVSGTAPPAAQSALLLTSQQLTTRAQKTFGKVDTGLLIFGAGLFGILGTVIEADRQLAPKRAAGG